MKTDITNKDVEEITNNYNKWVECTGVVLPKSSYYYEILSMLYDAYERGLNNKNLEL